MKLSTLVVLLTAAINSSSFGVIAQAQKPGIGVEELGRLDTLPQFKSSVKVASDRKSVV